MKEYIFTFGFGQKYQGCYHAVEAKDADEARKVMIGKFGTQWSMQYDSRDAAGVEKFNLKEIK